MKKTLTGFVIVLGALHLEAQTFEDSVTVSVVEVPVTVADERGQPVTDLSVSDFVLYDDGVEQEIEYFESIDVATAVMQERSDPTVRPVPRLHVMLLFDLTNVQPASLTRAREAAMEFVSSGLDEGALASVATFSYESGVRILTSFTRNGRLLELAIDSIGSSRGFQIADPLLLSASGSLTTGPQGGAAGGVGDEAVEIAREFDRINNQLNNEYNRMRLEVQLDTLANLARTVSSVSGRKQVILLSEGFEEKLIQGRELTSEENLSQLETVARGEIWRIDSDERFGFTSAREILKRMGEVFRQSDVVMHAVDVSGVRSYVDAREGFAKRSNEALHLLTEPTGGQVFKNTNQLSGSLEKVMTQQRHIYMLAFRPTTTTGEFHELQVRVRGRSGLRVTHREGYFEPDPTRITRLTAADVLINDIPLRDVRIDTVTVPFFLDEYEAVVPVIVEIDGEDLLTLAGEGDLDAELFVYAFEDDEVVDFRHQLIEINLEQAAEKLSQGGLKYYGVLRLPRGVYAVKSLLQIDGTTAGGFDRVELDMRHGQAFVSAPVLRDDTERWIMIRSADRSTVEARYPFVWGEESFVPAAHGVVASSAEESLAVYSSGLDWSNAKIRGGVRGIDGRSRNVEIRLTGVESGGGALQMDRLFLEMDLEDVTPADYFLDLEITQPDGEKIIRSGSFTVTDEIRAPGRDAPKGE